MRVGVIDISIIYRSFAKKRLIVVYVDCVIYVVKTCAHMATKFRGRGRTLEKIVPALPKLIISPGLN